MTGALFELRGGRQTAMFVLGAINFALGTLILFFRPAQQCVHAVRHMCMQASHVNAEAAAGFLSQSICLLLVPACRRLQ